MSPFATPSSIVAGEHWQTLEDQTLEDRMMEMMTTDPLQETKVEAVQNVHHHHHLQHRLKVVTPQALLVRLLPSQEALGVPQEAEALEETL